MTKLAPEWVRTSATKIDDIKSKSDDKNCSIVFNIQLGSKIVKLSWNHYIIDLSSSGSYIAH